MYRGVVVRRGLVFGLLRDIEKRTQILGEIFGGMLRAINSFCRMCWDVSGQLLVVWDPAVVLVCAAVDYKNKTPLDEQSRRGVKIVSQGSSGDVLQVKSPGISLPSRTIMTGRPVDVWYS